MNFIKKGFTLIELLVVIAIIGILTSVITANLQGARLRARDSHRKSDLQAVNQALRLYYIDHQSFPDSSSGVINGCGTNGTTTCPWNTSFNNNTTVYMGNLPLDPASTAGSQVNYYYIVASDKNNFGLLAKLENISDSDIADSHAKCATMYGMTLPDYTKDATKDYMVCAE